VLNVADNDVYFPCGDRWTDFTVPTITLRVGFLLSFVLMCVTLISCFYQLLLLIERAIRRNWVMLYWLVDKYRMTQ